MCRARIGTSAYYERIPIIGSCMLHTLFSATSETLFLHYLLGVISLNNLKDPCWHRRAQYLPASLHGRMVGMD